jgi:hypothetical protein
MMLVFLARTSQAQRSITFSFDFSLHKKALWQKPQRVIVKALSTRTGNKLTSEARFNFRYLAACLSKDIPTKRYK